MLIGSVVSLDSKSDIDPPIVVRTLCHADACRHYLSLADQSSSASAVRTVSATPSEAATNERHAIMHGTIRTRFLAEIMARFPVALIRPEGNRARSDFDEAPSQEPSDGPTTRLGDPFRL